jgi:hypothetical protein
MQRASSVERILERKWVATIEGFVFLDSMGF